MLDIQTRWAAYKASTLYIVLSLHPPYIDPFLKMFMVLISALTEYFY